MRTRALLVLLVLALATPVAPLCAQAAGSPIAESLTELDQLVDAVADRRSEVFGRLVDGLPLGASAPLPDRLTAHLEAYPADRGEMERLLPGLLAHEASLRTPPTRESYSRYVSDLVAVVATLRTPLAGAPLADFVSRDPMAGEGLVALAEAAIDPLVRRVEEPDPAMRAAIARTLGALTSADALPMSNRPKWRAKLSLLYLLEDTDPTVRLAAVKGLESFLDGEVGNLMNEIVTSDPYEDDEGRYPVREAAAAWLTKALIRR